MTEMIDRVAKAIQEALPLRPHDEVVRHAARAAIGAMREPTSAMLAAIPKQEYTIEHYHGTGHHRTFPTLGAGPIGAWRAMIDRALER